MTEKSTFAPRKKHFWSGNMRLSWDRSTMPMINNDLQVTKNEITLQVFKVKNSERAGKVLAGASTDMEDMMNLCNHYGIDICQFMRLPDGTHPVMLHRDQLEQLRRAAMGEGEEEPEESVQIIDEPEKPEPEPTVATQTEMRYLNDANVGELIGLLRKQDEKIAALYERIVELTADNMRMHEKIRKDYPDLTSAGAMVADAGSNDYR